MMPARASDIVIHDPSWIRSSSVDTIRGLREGRAGPSF